MVDGRGARARDVGPRRAARVAVGALLVLGAASLAGCTAADVALGVGASQEPRQVDAALPSGDVVEMRLDLRGPDAAGPSLLRSDQGRCGASSTGFVVAAGDAEVVRRDLGTDEQLPPGYLRATVEASGDVSGAATGDPVEATLRLVRADGGAEEVLGGRLTLRGDGGTFVGAVSAEFTCS